MKKVLFIAFFALIGMSQAEAQVSFKPGIRGGVNFAHFTKGDNYYYYDSYNTDPYYNGVENDPFSSRTSFYVGFYGALKLTKYYTLQPEIDYSGQGSTYKYIDSNGQNRTDEFDLGYLSIAVVNKFTFNKFNVHVGPTIDFIVDENIPVDNEVDLAFQLGAGFDITPNFGLEARIKKGIIPVIDYNTSHTNVVFSVGATYTFDVK